MSTFEYLNFVLGNAFFEMPLIAVLPTMMIALGLGAMLVGMLWKGRGGGESSPPAEQRKAA